MGSRKPTYLIPSTPNNIKRKKTMPTTPEEISEFLKIDNINYTFIKDNLISFDLTRTFEEGTNNEYEILSTFYIHVDEIETTDNGGEYVLFRVQRIIENLQNKIKESSIKANLFEHLIKLNATQKIGRWCFDVDAGVIFIDHGLPVEDAIITYKQFDRIYNTLANSIFETASEIESIINPSNN